MEITKKLIRDLDTTEVHTGQIEGYVVDVRTTLSNLHKDLDVSRKVNDSLHHLKSALDTSERLLTTVAIIPKIRTSANHLRASIEQFQKPVQSALKASDAVERLVKPMREYIEKAEPRLKKLDEALIVTMNVENEMEDALCSVVKCITTAPDSGTKESLKEQLEKFSGRVDPWVLEFDSAQVTIISYVEKARELSSRIQNWVSQLTSLNIEVNNLINLLQPLFASLRAIESAFRHVVRVPYGGHPDFCTEDILGVSVPYPCGWVTVYFSFSIEQLLNGVQGVAQPVLELLDSAMNAILDPLLSALNLHIELPTIPGLRIIEEMKLHLEGVIEEVKRNVEQVVEYLPRLTDFTEEIRRLIHEVLNLNAGCIEAKSQG
uniref:hypothetical protein n=3 Tax=Roseivirga sp. TaxID=1964215 RepID=UPI004047F277